MTEAVVDTPVVALDTPAVPDREVGYKPAVGCIVAGAARLEP
jgi:hypothetical protein